jgi:hypothetical protein
MSEIKFDHERIIAQMVKNAFKIKDDKGAARADLFFELIYAIGVMIKSQEGEYINREEFTKEVNKVLNHVLKDLDREFEDERVF